mmetsp:Transcript_5798/g.7762  ORF Transcript_5798/g.7762 Transcript_5798/m.7762 type:complete len:84 (-) Transcript_5798:200-451(-)
MINLLEHDEEKYYVYVRRPTWQIVSSAKVMCAPFLSGIYCDESRQALHPMIYLHISFCIVAIKPLQLRLRISAEYAVKSTAFP